MSEAAPPAGPPPPDWEPAPWGLLHTGLGLVWTVLLWLVVGVAVGALAVGHDEKSLVFRYSLVLGGELTLLAAPLLTVALVRCRIAALGLRGWNIASLLEGAAAGAGLWALTEAYVKALDHWAPAVAARMHAEELRQMELLAGPWPLLLAAAVLLAPFTEEVFFRGFLFAGLRGRLGFALASGLSAALFSGIHLMPWSFAPLFLVGLGCAVTYERRRTLLAPLALHMVYNGVSLLVDAVKQG